MVDPKVKDSVPPKRTLKEDVIPRLKQVLGGELGSALAEGLLILHEKGELNGQQLEEFGRSLARVRTDAKSAAGTANSAERTANEAKTLATSAKTDVEGATTTADNASKNAENALGKAAEALQKTEDVKAGSDEAAERIEGALAKAARQAENEKAVSTERVDELAGMTKALQRAVDAFGTEVDTLKSVALKASDDATHAVELLETAGEIVKNIEQRTSADVESANARIEEVKKGVDEVRNSIPPAANGNGKLPIDEVVRRARGERPTPKPTGEDVEEAALNAALTTYESGPKALKLAQQLEASFNGFVAAVTGAIANVDKKLQLIAIAGNASDEELDAVAKPSLEYDNTKR